MTRTAILVTIGYALLFLGWGLFFLWDDPIRPFFTLPMFLTSAGIFGYLIFKSGD